MYESNFISDVKAGRAKSNDIDAYIEYWHTHENTPRQLITFLGMSKREYALWVRDDSILPAILRQHGITI